ncbi:neuroglian-like isoform X2 [Babylonia areolata]|uniref:neuroglian-like isoform X2 n=1 Tax=Babylonia areolata TaxID=304850 RepID=UPI003FD2BB4D
MEVVHSSGAIFTLLIVLHMSFASKEEIRNCQPAAITKQARRKLYFQQNGDAVIDCVAKGNQTLKYTWLKDGVELDTDLEENKKRMNVKPGGGDLILSPALETDAGVYQCKVQNPCGTSLSHKVSLFYSFIDPFTKEEPETVSRVVGSHLKLTCKPPLSVPEATVKWILSGDENEVDPMEVEYGGQEDDDPSKMFNPVDLGRRITMDYDGNLHFVYVKKEDAQNGKRYVCMAVNNEVRSLNQGEDKIIVVYESSNYEVPVLLKWSSNDDVLALEGQKAKFKCIFSGYPLPTVRWRRSDGGRLDEDRMKQSVDDHEFIISDVKAEDAGEYECSGQNPSHNEVKRKTFKLTVESYPRWKKRPRDMKVGVEDDVTVVCRASGTPKPKVQWYINGLPLEEVPRAKNRQLRGDDLVFTNLTQDDSQVIQCNVSNIHGYQWVDVFLQVEALEPEIVSKPTQQKVAEDRDIIIPCGVVGKPRPKVRWYKGNQHLLDDRYKILPNGDLQIADVTPRDSDNYRCIAENRFGEAEAEGSLVVRTKTEISSKPKDEKVSAGENVVFTCGAVTDGEEMERLRYIWLKDGKEVDISDPRVRTKDGKLIINTTNSKDTGEYTCIATNDLDKDEASATLEVKAPPDPPYNVSMASCGDMEVDLTWEFRAEQSNFSPLQEFIVECNTSHAPGMWQEAFRVSAAQRQGKHKMDPWTAYSFRVRARNLMGVSEPSNLTHPPCESAETRPFTNPENVKTVGDKTGWLVIEWEPMPKTKHGSKDFRYEVSYQGEDDPKPHTRNVTKWDQDRLEVEVDGVFKPYTVTVRAFNSLGESLKVPESVKGHSGEAPPSVVPQNFEVDPNETVTATSAGFMWDPVDISPENMNGEFQGYKIRYWKEDQMDSTLHEELIIIPDSRSRRATPRGSYDNKIRGKVSNLPSFSRIEADVVVVNKYFSSNGSNVVNFTTPEGIPSRVDYLEALFRGSAHFLLEWGPPTEANGILTGYELGYMKINGLVLDDPKVHRDDLPPSQRRANIDGLDADSLYRIYVAARTKIGPGQKYFIDVRTSRDNSELAEPRITSVYPSEHGVNISFSLSDEEKGQRTSSVYYLEYRKFGDHDWDRDNEGATDHFWLTLKELDPATTYEVRVVSVPKTGDQTKSSRETRFITTGFGYGFGFQALALVMENGTQASSNKTSDHSLGGAKKGSVLSAGWFIGMMVAIAILLLILIIVCIVKRNRGKEYKFPPEKDTVDEAPGHFNEMAKSEKNGVNSSASFERDPEKVPLEDETDSLEDYGDVDPTKFNEDGSFIGQYGDTKPEAPNPSAMSSIV